MPILQPALARSPQPLHRFFAPSTRSLRPRRVSGYQEARFVPAPPPAILAVASHPHVDSALPRPRRGPRALLCQG